MALFVSVCVSMEVAHCTTNSISSSVKGQREGLLNYQPKWLHLSSPSLSLLLGQNFTQKGVRRES